MVKAAQGRVVVPLDEDKIVEQFGTGDFTFQTLAEKHNTTPSAILGVIEDKAPDLAKAYWAKRAGADAASQIVSSEPRVETTTFETITPEGAKAYLIHNTTNRGMSEAVIRRYAADIQAGRWKRNGASIVFGRSGRLLDGQHRLHAVVRANQPVEFLIVRNADDAVFDTIDSGKSRSVQDIVGLMGVAAPKIISPAARLAYAYASGGAVSKAPPRVALTEFVRLNPGLSIAVEAVSNPRLQFPKAPLAACLFLASPMSLHPKAADFVEGLATGVGLEKGDPRIALREWEVTERKRGRGQLRADAAFTATTRAWNAFATGKSIVQVRSVKGASRNNLPIVGYRPENVIGATLVGTLGRHALRSGEGGLFAPLDPTAPVEEMELPNAIQGESPEMLAAIQEYVEEEGAITALATKHGVSKHTLGGLLRKSGLTRTGGGGVASSRGLDHAEVIALYASGDYTYATLGTKFGVDPSAIYYVLKHKAPHLMKGLANSKKAA